MIRLEELETKLENIPCQLGEGTLSDITHNVLERNKGRTTKRMGWARSYITSIYKKETE